MPAEFNSKYLSELYLIQNQTYANQIALYCEYNKNSSQIELANCNTVIKVTNVWYKLYTYSGLMLNNIFGFKTTIAIFVWILVIIFMLKDIRKWLRTRRAKKLAANNSSGKTGYIHLK